MSGEKHRYFWAKCINPKSAFTHDSDGANEPYLAGDGESSELTFLDAMTRFVFVVTLTTNKSPQNQNC